ncbi:MAG TPA: hypothetical protein VMB52_05010 [Verrucomicrobiae bacterium]|nr:hypothetical protein [Verrucomicrobiae bacterium]
MQSPKCFWAIVTAFVIESLWIAVSSSYPMAFDEDFHLGIIRLYAKQWSPFFAHQPANGDAFGSLTSDPSYMYHYLMSFPYRLTTLITHSQTAQIITLRCIDVALVACSLIIFRKLLLKATVPTGITNTVLLFFILVPVLPLLAGQINYDDMLLPLAAYAILCCLELREQFENGYMPIGLLLKLFAVCMFTSLVQYEFLPIFAAITFYVIYGTWKYRKQEDTKEHKLRVGWQLAKGLYKFSAVFFFLIAFSLFGQRYGTNLMAYKSPIPQCNQVLTIAQCSAYSPWLRNYTDSLQKTSVNTNPIHFAIDWARGMFEHTFYVSSGGGSKYAYYAHAGPLPVIAITAIIVFSAGIVLLLANLLRKNSILKEHKPFALLLYVAVFYCFVLWLWNYHDYLHLGAAVALNGRYLFPVLPIILAAIGLAYDSWLKQRIEAKALLLSGVFLLFLQGGGALTYIAVSNTNWYWNDTIPKDMNAAAQVVVKPLTIPKPH